MSLINLVLGIPQHVCGKMSEAVKRQAVANLISLFLHTDVKQKNRNDGPSEANVYKKSNIVLCYACLLAYHQSE